MEPDDWIRRWADGKTGFHRPTVQTWLAQHLRRLAPRGDECILVPLCGKSVDLAWLEGRGHPVVGVEVAEQALRAFLAEQRRTVAEHSSPPFIVFATGTIELWCGDFFALDPLRHGDFPAIFDRAAMVALPVARRDDYAKRLLSLLRAGGRLLLVGLEFDESKFAGPPFSLTRAEVTRRMGDACEIEFLGEQSLIDTEPSWREKGLEAIVEYALLLTKRR